MQFLYSVLNSSEWLNDSPMHLTKLRKSAEYNKQYLIYNNDIQQYHINNVLITLLQLIICRHRTSTFTAWVYCYARLINNTVLYLRSVSQYWLWTVTWSATTPTLETARNWSRPTRRLKEQFHLEVKTYDTRKYGGVHWPRPGGSCALPDPIS